MQQSFDLRLLNMFLAAFYFFDKKLLSLTKKNTKESYLLDLSGIMYRKTIKTKQKYLSSS